MDDSDREEQARPVDANSKCAQSAVADAFLLLSGLSSLPTGNIQERTILHDEFLSSTRWWNGTSPTDHTTLVETHWRSKNRAIPIF